MEYSASPGEHINTSATEMERLAEAHKVRVTSSFNDVHIYADPGESAEMVVRRFNEEMDRRQKAYAESPEGIASAARRAEAEKIATAAAAEGILPFACADKVIWQSWVEANTDDYGAAVMRYAARWANLMDAQIAAGSKLEQIADKASHDADKEGISGAMYGFAVVMLSKCWEHGETLRVWHNRKTQIGSEGDKANETGGVLNPAMLRVG